MNMKVTIVIPTFNEGRSIEYLVPDLKDLYPGFEFWSSTTVPKTIRNYRQKMPAPLCTPILIIWGMVPPLKPVSEKPPVIFLFSWMVTVSMSRRMSLSY